jgi:ferric-dicitrate binding protein FerR (iron transport regulator)
MKRIVVDPPVSEARRERVERQLFQQLAAVRVVDRAEAVIPRPKKSRNGYWFAFGGLAAAALALILLTTRDGGTGGQPIASPSRVVTPVAGETTFMIGRDAVIGAKSDTSVEWQQGNDGSITLTLERGAVDCQVEPRHGRPPFKVISGDVTVIVVGTRFTVSHNPSPRVDVAHGKVRVEAPGGTWFVEAGESWTPIGQVAAAKPEVTAEPIEEPVVEEPAPEIEMDPLQLPRAKKAAANDGSDSARSPKRDARSPIAPPASRELAGEA